MAAERIVEHLDRWQYEVRERADEPRGRWTSIQKLRRIHSSRGAYCLAGRSAVCFLIASYGWFDRKRKPLKALI